MVPRTSNCAVDHQSLNEGAVVVSAVSSDCEKFTPDTRQQHLFFTNMTEHLCSIGDLVLRKAKGKIRTGRFGMIQHSVPFGGADLGGQCHRQPSTKPPQIPMTACARERPGTNVSSGCLLHALQPRCPWFAPRVG